MKGGKKMTTFFLILFSLLLSPAINGGPPLRKIYKDQLRDPRKIVDVLTQISKRQLKAPGIK
jgi:hypothetical protein